MRLPVFKFHLSIKMVVWALVSIAMLLAAGYLIISYIYQIQDNTKELMAENAIATRDAQELRLQLYKVRAISLKSVFDQNEEQILRLESEQKKFLSLLSKIGRSANTPEENLHLQRISALFSNYQQTLKNAFEMHKQGRLSQPGAVIVLASQELINTIEEKTNALIDAKEQAQQLLKKSIQANETIITTAIYSLGISGIIMGLILGWLIARIILNPIYKLVLKVRDAAGSEMIEHIRMTPGKELEELDLHINRMIGRINKANDDLQKNKELLERSVKLAAIGKIAPALAHEIRNPLTSIKMLVHSLMEEASEGSEQKTDLNIILMEISRMEDFLQNFLKFARPPRPKTEMIVPVEIIEQILQLMQPQLKQYNIQLIQQHHQRSLSVKADPSMLRQVMMNLIINAIDMMRQGGTLTIGSLESVNSNGKMAVISVADTGPGIPDELIDNMFEPFVKGKEHGIGLGLSISQRIAEMHHGWIEAKNLQQGAVFSLYLPMEAE